MRSDRIVVAQLVSDFVAGGIERNIRFMAKPMADQGVDFVLISLNDNIEAGPELEAARVPCYGLTDDWKPIRYPIHAPAALMAKLQKIKREHHIDLIHAHHYTAIGAAPLVASAFGTPFVVTHHNTEERWQTGTGARMAILRRHMKHAFTRSKAILCWTSAVVEDVTRACGQSLPQATIVELPISDRFFQCADPAAVRDVDVVMVGRLAEQKNVLFALDVFSRLPHLRVLILGGGPQDTAVRERAAALGLGDRVEIAGNVGPDEVIAGLNRSKVQYMPSLFEGLSAAFIEALAMGLDAVVSDIPSFRAPFKAEPGLSFASNTDVEENVRVLTEAVKAYRFRPRPYLRERFSQENYCRRVADIYRQSI
jgi:glycosyltransferase involved in cell wall biosynthesis